MLREPKNDESKVVKSICPFQLLKIGNKEPEDNEGNLTNLRKAIGKAISDPNETNGIVSNILSWLNVDEDMNFNGFVKTSKHLGASSLLTTIKNQCKNEKILVAYIACGLSENKSNSLTSDKFYYRLKDLLNQDELNEEYVLMFFVKTFNLSNIIDNLGELCRDLKDILKDNDISDDKKVIIGFFKKNLNLIKNDYCNKFLSEKQCVIDSYIKPESSYRREYDNAFDVFCAYYREILTNKINNIKKYEDIIYSCADKRVKSSDDNSNKNIVILLDDLELAIEKMIGNNLIDGKKIFDNAKILINIINDINLHDKGVKFIVPIRSRIFNVNNLDLGKGPLYISKGWENFFNQKNNSKLENILMNLLDNIENGGECTNKKCEFIWDGDVNNKIFSSGKLSKLVNLCDNNPYYLFRSLFLAYRGISYNDICTLDADKYIKKYFNEQFNNDVFELLNLYLLDSIKEDETLKNLDLSKVLDAAICWVKELIKHSRKVEDKKDKNYKHIVCTIYARKQVSDQNEEYGKLLGEKFIRKAIIGALQDVKVIMLRKHDKYSPSCPTSCYPSNVKLYKQYYKDSNYKDFVEFFRIDYGSKKINIKEYILHPFIQYICNDETIFDKKEAV